MKKLTLILALSLLGVFATAQNKARVLRGYATYYAKFFEGRKTATGERFRHTGYTAASNHFPLGAIVRVTNLATGKSIIVRINDRMHPRMAAKKHIVDLTATCARKIGFYGKFITKCVVEQLNDDKLIAKS